MFSWLPECASKGRKTPPYFESTMATIKTLLTLTRLELTSLPAVHQATGLGEINSATARLWRRKQSTDPVGHCFTPCELGRVLWWWIKQPFAEAQLQQFLESEGNIAEEYLTCGKFSATNGQLQARLANLDTTVVVYGADPADEAPQKHSQRDKRGGLVVLLNEPLEVKQHRRVQKPHKEQFAKCILAEVKLKFGVPKRTQANYLAISRFAAEIIKHKGVRPTDAARIVPYVVHAAFIPSDDEISARRWLETTIATERLRGWQHMPTA